MQNITLTIVLGIVTGLVTASILLIFKSLFFNSFLPWYRQVMYQGVDLNGSWHTCTHSQKTLLELKQSCEKLSGKATVQMLNDRIPEDIRSNLHIDDIRTFDVSGVVSERFVSLTFWHTDKKRLGLSSYLLQVDGDGTTLTGQWCWYAPVCSKIRSGNITYYRDEERMMKKFNKLQKDINPINKNDSKSRENTSNLSKIES